MARRTGWTCQRQSAGVKCGTRNLPRTRKCSACGKPRPARRRPEHMAALDLTYEQYIELNGGEHCGVCGRERGSRRLDRDHDHGLGVPRGLLCARCNRALPSWITPQWLRLATYYLEKERP
jgi:hypothetical protein